MALSLYKHFIYGTLTDDQVDSNWTDIEQEVSSLSTRLPLNNYAATTNPTVNDDVTQGYAPGSLWYNRSNNQIFLLVSANSGAAHWVDYSAVSPPPVDSFGVVRNDVAAMVASVDLRIGISVRTLEHTAGYGYEGGNLYKIVAGGTGTADNGSYIDLDNGLQAMGLFPNGVNVKQFGAHPSLPDNFACFKAAASLGRSVDVPSGTFSFRNIDGYIKAMPGAVWKFQPDTTIFVPDDAVVATGFSDGNPLFGSEASEEHPHGFAMHGGSFIIEKGSSQMALLNIQRRGTKNLMFDAVVFDGKGAKANNCASSAISINGCVNSTLRNCDIRYTAGGSVAANQSSFFTVEDCKFLYTGVDASYPFSNPADAVEGTHWWNASAVGMSSSNNVRFRRNYIEKTGGTAVFLRTAYLDTYNNHVIGNVAVDIGKGFCGLGTPDYVTAPSKSYNHVVRDNIVMGCCQRLLGGSGVGVSVGNAHGAISNIEISNNYISLINEWAGETIDSYPNYAGGSSSGIFADMFNAQVFGEGLVVRNNTIKHFPYMGIYVEKWVRVSIEGNTLEKCSWKHRDDGIYDQGGTGWAYVLRVRSGADVSIKDNSFIDSYLNYQSGRAGVVFIGPANLVDIKDNKFLNRPGYGAASAVLFSTSPVTVTGEYSDIYSTTDNAASVNIENLRVSGVPMSDALVTGAGQINSSNVTLIGTKSSPMSTGGTIPPNADGGIMLAGRAIRTGRNSPEGAVAAPIGSLYLNTVGASGTTLYIKESGTGDTGWQAK